MDNVTLAVHPKDKDKLATKEDIGRMHMFLGEWAKLVDKVRPMIKAYVKGLVDDIVFRPDNKPLIIQKRMVWERLLQAPHRRLPR